MADLLPGVGAVPGAGRRAAVGSTPVTHITQRGPGLRPPSFIWQDRVAISIRYSGRNEDPPARLHSQRTRGSWGR